MHDFGGPIGLNAAINHPGRFKKLIIINSWLWSSESDPDFQKIKWVLKSPLLPFLYRYLNFETKVLLPASFGDKKPGREIRRHYSKPFNGHKEQGGTVAFARSLVNDQEWFQELWDKKDAISDKPVQLVWGMKDPIVKLHNLEKFQKGFPNSNTLELETAGHFPHEEVPERVTDAIAGFLETNGSNTLKAGINKQDTG